VAAPSVEPSQKTAKGRPKSGSPRATLARRQISATISLPKAGPSSSAATPRRVRTVTRGVANRISQAAAIASVQLARLSAMAASKERP
jgi:hypothetical protein